MKPSGLNKQANKLFNEQIEEWELVRTNYAGLASVQTKTFSFNGFEIKTQFNPARIRSSAAKLDTKTLSERACFLCSENRPEEQKNIDAGDYTLLVNPYPIFPEHFTIPRKKHVPQQIKPFFSDMLELAKALDNYILFYNGPKCGASAPDHMHFQAGTKNFLPLIDDYNRLKPTRGILLEENKDIKLYTLKNYLRTVICIESEDISSAVITFEKLYAEWQGTSTEEPMMNIICNYQNEKWYIFILPRKNSRPWQFYSPYKEKQLLISPASVEMSGIFITPIQEHFEKITKEDISDILAQSSTEILNPILIDHEPEIQVGIMYNTHIEFVLNGDFVASNGKIYTGAQLLNYQAGNIVFDEEPLSTLTFRPIKKNCNFDLLNVVIGIGFHWERKENQRFSGNLKFIIENNRITAINEVKLESYLTSVISSEMSAKASNELLKAHAVISRSWLLANIDKSAPKTQIPFNKNNDEYIKWYERDDHQNFHVCADDHCQRYQGITRSSTQAVEKAIEATLGEVLMYENKICDTRFSKSCGGISETFENAWADVPHPYLTKVIDNPEAPEGFNTNLTIEANAQEWIRQSPDAFCNTHDKNILSQVLNDYDQETIDFYRWKAEYSQVELSALILKKSGIDFGAIIDLIPIQRGVSGRIITLKIVGTKKTLIVGKELEIRKWLSESHLYSSAFVVDKSEIINAIPQKFILTGAGWGHGVGLCQIGAAVMGEKGYGYEKILSHYFSGAELKKIY